MRAYCITIEGLPESVASYEEARESCAQFGLELLKHPATTPDDDIEGLYKRHGLPSGSFDETWSRRLPCMSAFFSHWSLWGLCAEVGEGILVLEHDARMIGQLPPVLPDVVNLGRPSFGKFNVPKRGVGPLVSKKYFPGAHAYSVQPARARVMVELAKTEAAPTDVYRRVDRFPWLKEAFPWPFKVEESFSTIQNKKGCKAKHQYDEKYRLL